MEDNMSFLFSLWKPKSTTSKRFKKVVVSIIAILLFTAICILPFLSQISITFNIFKWLWIALLLCNLDFIIKQIKDAKQKEMVSLSISFCLILTLIYINEYFYKIQTSIIVIFCIIFILSELFIWVLINKQIKLFEKAKPISIEKQNRSMFIIGYIFVLGCLLFTLSIILNIDYIRYIIGGILIVSFTFSILKGISNLKSKNTFSISFFVLDIICMLSLIVYLIYTIQDIDLRNIILTIVSAIIGGILTLAGVAWTIKYGEKERTRQDYDKAKPMFTLFSIDYDIVNKSKDFSKISFELDLKIDPSSQAQIIWGSFINSDNSNFYIENVFPINVEHIPKQKAILKNQKFLLRLIIYTSDFMRDIEEVVLTVQDIFGRKFYYKIESKVTKIDGQYVLMKELVEFTEITYEEFQKIIADYKLKEVERIKRRNGIIKTQKEE
jgi:membrane protein